MKKLPMVPNVIILDELDLICPILTKEIMDNMMRDFDESKLLFEKTIKHEYSFTRSNL